MSSLIEAQVVFLFIKAIAVMLLWAAMVVLLSVIFTPVGSGNINPAKLTRKPAPPPAPPVRRVG